MNWFERGIFTPRTKSLIPSNKRLNPDGEGVGDGVGVGLGLGLGVGVGVGVGEGRTVIGVSVDQTGPVGLPPTLRTPLLGPPVACDQSVAKVPTFSSKW